MNCSTSTDPMGVVRAGSENKLNSITSILREFKLEINPYTQIYLARVVPIVGENLYYKARSMASSIFLNAFDVVYSSVTYIESYSYSCSSSHSSLSSVVYTMSESKELFLPL